MNANTLPWHRPPIHITNTAPLFHEGNTLAVRTKHNGTVSIAGNAARDPDGDTLIYTLIGPAGIDIDAETGEISGYTGMHNGCTMQLWRTATNGAGQQATQVITLAVVR